jgi:hypothetical protein
MEVPVAPSWRPAYVYPDGRSVQPQERAYPTEPTAPAPAAPSAGIDTKDLLIGGAVLVALVAIFS